MHISHFIKKFNIFRKPLAALNTIHINKQALLNNYDHLTHISSGEIFPVLKANAYGHGIEMVAEILQERRPKYIVVDSYYEGLMIHKIAPKQKILCIGHNLQDNLHALNYRWFTPSILHIDTIEELGKLSKQLTIHIKINTGMNRQGLDPSEIPEALKCLKKYPQLRVEGIFSHFSESEEANSSYNTHQIQVFEDVVQMFHDADIYPEYLHINNSGGALNGFSKITNISRCGLSLYGISPHHKYRDELQPILSLNTQLINKRILRMGESVGYNRTYTATEDMIIGTIPVGYYEGISRNLSNMGYFMYRGKQLPIIGRVSMNLITLDLRDAPEIQIEDTISILGDEGIDIYQMAAWQDTIPYEVTTGLSSSIRRIVV